VPTSAIDAVSNEYATNRDDVGAAFMGRATIPDAVARAYAYAEAVTGEAAACL